MTISTLLFFKNGILSPAVTATNCTSPFLSPKMSLAIELASSISKPSNLPLLDSLSGGRPSRTPTLITPACLISSSVFAKMLAQNKAKIKSNLIKSPLLFSFEIIIALYILEKINASGLKFNQRAYASLKFRGESGI